MPTYCTQNTKDQGTSFAWKSATPKGSPPHTAPALPTEGEARSYCQAQTPYPPKTASSNTRAPNVSRTAEDAEALHWNPRCSAKSRWIAALISAKQHSRLKALESISSRWILGLNADSADIVEDVLEGLTAFRLWTRGIPSRIVGGWSWLHLPARQPTDSKHLGPEGMMYTSLPVQSEMPKLCWRSGSLDDLWSSRCSGRWFYCAERQCC